MSKTEIDKSYFITFCIEQYKVHARMDGAVVAEMFFQKGVVDYLSENFEVLHTQSKQWLMEEIDNYIKSQASEIIEL